MVEKYETIYPVFAARLSDGVFCAAGKRCKKRTSFPVMFALPVFCLRENDRAEKITGSN